MPEVKLEFEGLPDLLPMTGRSPGMHISTVINDLCVKLGHYEANDDGPDMTRMGLGSAFEHILRHRFALQDPDRYLEIGELEKDGLFGTPDLFDLFEMEVDEVKLTWMSSRHTPLSEKFWKYEVQIKAYCWMMEVHRARLHVCHINGDYTYGSKSGGPKYRVWSYVFTPQELLENWKMLLSHGRVMSSKKSKSRRPR